MIKLNKKMEIQKGVSAIWIVLIIVVIGLIVWAVIASQPAPTEEEEGVTPTEELTPGEEEVAPEEEEVSPEEETTEEEETITEEEVPVEEEAETE